MSPSYSPCVFWELVSLLKTQVSSCKSQQALPFGVQGAADASLHRASSCSAVGQQLRGTAAFHSSSLKLWPFAGGMKQQLLCRLYTARGTGIAFQNGFFPPLSFFAPLSFPSSIQPF